MRRSTVSLSAKCQARQHGRCLRRQKLGDRILSWLRRVAAAQWNGASLQHVDLVDNKGAIVGKYRKVHLPGHADHRPGYPLQHLEKRYFEPGDLGFPVWRAFDGNVGMCICNDRRWPETYRVMGCKGSS